MDFTKEIIEEFWTKTFTYKDVSFTRNDWTPDKYNGVARYSDEVMQKLAEVIYQFVNGDKNSVTDYMMEKETCSLFSGWFYHARATEEEKKEIGEEKDIRNYFFGSKKFERVCKCLLPIFSDLVLYGLFDCKDSPLFNGEPKKANINKG
jgi:hypothetical protein